MASRGQLWKRMTTLVWDCRLYIFVAGASLIFGLGLAAIYATVVDRTETLAFCAHSCHEMQGTVYAEYAHTVHFRNAHGVVVTCADCHIPRDNWPAAMATKVAGMSEIWDHIFAGESDLKVFGAQRPALEKAVLAGFAQTNARACKSCHVYANMVLSSQNEAARAMHAQAMKTNANCLDCHRGIAHADVLAGATAPAAYMLTDAVVVAQSSLAQHGSADGQAIYDKNCAACHTAMSPKLGDKGAWAPLLKAGQPALVEATIHGKVIMPPRGGNASLSDGDIKAAVQYMIGKSQ